MVTWFLCFWASHKGWEQERKRWPQVPLQGGAPNDFCPTVSLCHVSVAPQTVDQAFRAWAFGDIPYLKHGSHSPLSFSRILDSLFLIPHGDASVSVMTSAHWRVHAEDVKSHFVFLARWLGQFDMFLFWSLMHIFQKEAAVWGKLVSFFKFRNRFKMKL